MEISLYIFYSIIGFLSFFMALLYNKGLHSVFIWPISFLSFSLLIFSIPDMGLIWFNIGILFYVSILMLWDVYDKFIINLGE